MHPCFQGIFATSDDHRALADIADKYGVRMRGSWVQIEAQKP